jgi:hypothetical protein
MSYKYSFKFILSIYDTIILCHPDDFKVKIFICHTFISQGTYFCPL